MKTQVWTKSYEDRRSVIGGSDARIIMGTAAVRIVDMSASNAWADLAAVFRTTRPAFLEHERAKSELKSIMPEDAKEAIGHGIRAKRSRSGAVSFDLLELEASHAPLQ